METPAEVPMRVAPAAIMASAVSRSRIPPDALTPMSGPTVCLINRTCSHVAPAVPNPVEVLTKSTPAALQISQALTMSSLLR